MGADNRTMTVHRTNNDDGRGPVTRRPASWSPLARCAACALVTLMTFALAPSAGADEPGETTQGYLLVQQALGHLAHDTGHEGMDLAMEKVEDALATKDQAGVDAATLEKAKTALEAEQVDAARAELQDSITQALRNLPPATGEDTGTTVVLPALDTRGGMSGKDWVFVAISLLALVSGILLAIRFRPADSVGELRQRLGEKP